MALEMARRLLESGYQLAPLVLVDTHLPAGATLTGEEGKHAEATLTSGNEFARYFAAARNYAPKYYSGQLFLLCLKEKRFSAYDPIGKWHGMANTLYVRWVDGGHINCLTRHIHSLGTAIEEIISTC